MEGSGRSAGGVGTPPTGCGEPGGALRRGLHLVGRYVRRSPLTYGWLGILFATTLAQRAMTESELDRVLWQRSTNILNLTEHPVRVLVGSLFWIDGSSLLPYVVTFTVFLAPAERWLGGRRWLAVGLTSHVVATLVSQGVLLYVISRGLAPSTLAGVRDVGVSYFQAGVTGVLGHHLAGRWRWAYLAGVLVVYVVPLVADPGLTTLGHLVAAAVGMASVPVARAAGGTPWDPVRGWDAAVRWWRSRRA